MTKVTSRHELIARIAVHENLQLGVAESLTGGALSAALARAPDAERWFAGGQVAYQLRTKRHVLGV